MSDDEAEFRKARLAAREAFEAGFRRNNRGNLTRSWEGLTLTVYEREDGFHWCIAGRGRRRPRFSRMGDDDEESVIGSSWEATEGRKWM